MKLVCYLIDMIIFQANSIEGLTYEPINTPKKLWTLSRYCPAFIPLVPFIRHFLSLRVNQKQLGSITFNLYFLSVSCAK